MLHVRKIVANHVGGEKAMNTHTHTQTNTYTFESTSGKAENMLKRRVGPRDDKHATE